MDPSIIRKMKYKPPPLPLQEKMMVKRNQEAGASASTLFLASFAWSTHHPHRHHPVTTLSSGWWDGVLLRSPSSVHCEKLIISMQRAVISAGSGRPCHLASRSGIPHKKKIKSNQIQSNKTAISTPSGRHGYSSRSWNSHYSPPPFPPRPPLPPPPING